MRLLSAADGHEDFWPAYTDILMVTCLVMMLLAATFALLRQDDRVQEELKRRKENFEALFNERMREPKAAGWVSLASPPKAERQVISFADTLLFKKGEADLVQPTGMAALWELSQLLKPLLNDQTHFHTVQVNGHTDPDPIHTPRFPSNWHLSSARATSVLYFLTQCHVPANRLTATGFAQFHPYDPDGSAITNKARMRRIEIVLQYPQDWIAEQLLTAKERRTVE